MGGLSCCESQERKQQLIINQIIAEDKRRVKSENRSLILQEHLDARKVKHIQKTFKGYLTKKRFYKYFELMKKLTIDELKYNKIENPDLESYLSERVREFEASSKVEDYENSQFYQENIKKWANNKFAFSFPAIYVDKLHNNDIYKGSWNIEKKFHGYGILVKADGSKYQGFWEGGLLSGVGRFYTSAGDFFEGNFLYGIAKGYGVFIHSDGTTYKGEWQNDQPHGLGKEYFPDGSFFEGTFLNGKKSGLGSFFWSDGSTYTGNIANEVFEGRGKYTWADGRVYEGDWADSQMNGEGKLIYSDGSFYEGEFLKNIRHGQGRYQWNEAKYYEGSWFNGQQHGKGYYFKNGKLVEGVWNKGKLQNHKVVPKPTIGYCPATISTIHSGSFIFTPKDKNQNNQNNNTNNTNKTHNAYNVSHVTISSFGENKSGTSKPTTKKTSKPTHTMNTKTKSLKKLTT